MQYDTGISSAHSILMHWNFAGKAHGWEPVGGDAAKPAAEILWAAADQYHPSSAAGPNAAGVRCPW